MQSVPTSFLRVKKGNQLSRQGQDSITFNRTRRLIALNYVSNYSLSEIFVTTAALIRPVNIRQNRADKM